MAILGAKNLSIAFGGNPLLKDAALQIERGERICLVGRNGVGKSTLMAILSGQLPPDGGEVWRNQGVTTGALAQDVPPGYQGTIFDIVAEGFPPHVSRGEAAQKIEEVLSRAGLDPAAPFAQISSGMKRRALFARAVAPEPDVLFLDEPTNHLDIEAILWMEGYLLRFVKTIVFITHDRAFLKKVATRILELDRGKIFSYDCNYDTYLERRAAELSAEETQNALFDKKLSQEETWIRQGIKARRTRNEGRVRVLKKLREAGAARRKKTGNVKLDIQEAERSGKLVIEAENLSYAYEEKPIVQDFSTLIMRGDKVGIIGPNGSGKTTLLNLLLKNLVPDEGIVRHGTNLEIAYFDQLRDILDGEKTVQDNIADGNNFVTINGERRHVVGYLKDFLFSPDRCRTPVRVLSGGEKNRLLLAKLFTRPANVIILDEPTNDLDAETLELLEERLFDFSGTLLLVSHDRSFLNNVVTSTIVFEENGVIAEYPGGYDDWLMQRPKKGGSASQKADATSGKRRKPAKLGYKEEKELGELPKRIELLEEEQHTLFARLADPLFYKTEKDTVQKTQERLTQVEQEVVTAYQRWEALEEKKRLSA